MRGLILHALGEPENLSLETLPDPQPGPGQVLVAMRAAAVNFPDLLTVRGEYQFRPELPFVPGKEGAGVVEAVGEGVTRLSPGDRVMVQVEYGCFAEKALAPEHDCFRMPDSMEFDDAAAIGIAFQTAWFALTDRANVQKGETVLVTGASGSVGIAAMQLAKEFGCTVIAGLTTMAKAEDAVANGADHVIDLGLGDPKQTIREQVDAITDGQGVDAVIEIVGGDVFAGALRCVKFRGRLVVVGFTGGEIATMRTNYVLLKNIAVLGVDRGQYREREPGWMRRAQDEIFQLSLDGRIRMPVQARFPLERFIGAFDVIRNRAVRGKVILRIGDS
jgi:NADPH2:quinone reductase